MKIDKFKLRSILIVSIILVSVGFAFFYQQGRDIQIEEDEISPPQRKIDVACKNFEKIKNEFKDIVIGSSLKQPNYNRDIYLKISETGPIEAYSYYHHFKGEIQMNKIQQLNEKFSIDIEPNLKKLGLIKKLTYSSFNLDFHQYQQGEDYYVISIPTNRESSVVSNEFYISCGEVGKDKNLIYTKIRSNYNQDNVLKILESNENLIILNVNSLDAISGFYHIYDLRNKTAELIYEGQESIKCSELQKKNLKAEVYCTND